MVRSKDPPGPMGVEGSSSLVSRAQPVLWLPLKPEPSSSHTCCIHLDVQCRVQPRHVAKLLRPHAVLRRWRNVIHFLLLHLLTPSPLCLFLQVLRSIVNLIILFVVDMAGFATALYILFILLLLLFSGYFVSKGIHLSAGVHIR